MADSSISKKGIELYEKIKEKIVSNQGKFIAIEVESGDYFFGENLLDAYQLGTQKHPGKEFYFKRVGAEASFVVGRKK